jgi:hypothetical protein
MGREKTRLASQWSLSKDEKVVEYCVPRDTEIKACPEPNPSEQAISLPVTSASQQLTDARQQGFWASRESLQIGRSRVVVDGVTLPVLAASARGSARNLPESIRQTARQQRPD